LITRIREESGSGIPTGIIRAVRSTGGVITSAGIIFAASMFGLLFGSLSTMVQTGFIVGVGLLIDTFVVRTITVPALAAMIGRSNWWPTKPTAAKMASFDIPIVAETSAVDIGFSDVRKARSTSCSVGEAAIERAQRRSWGEAHTDLFPHDLELVSAALDQARQVALATTTDQLRTGTEESPEAQSQPTDAELCRHDEPDRRETETPITAGGQRRDSRQTR
jgi:hypothetical protein